MAVTETLYTRLGGYDAVSAVADNLLPRLVGDVQLGRFWEHRGEDGMRREKQLLIEFLCCNAGGPLLYTGRDMKTTHNGMRLSQSDWGVFQRHLHATFEQLEVSQQERSEVLTFIDGLKNDIVKA